MSHPLNAVRRRLAQEESGFTLLELLIVLIILSILISIALPSYLSFKDKGRKTTASANIRTALTSINAYAADNYSGAPTSTDPDWNGTDAVRSGTNADGGYAGMSVTGLQKYNPALPATYVVDPAGYTYSGSSTTDYCVYITNGPWYAARKAADLATTVGKTMNLTTCTAS